MQNKVPLVICNFCTPERLRKYLRPTSTALILERSVLTLEIVEALRDYPTLKTLSLDQTTIRVSRRWSLPKVERINIYCSYATNEEASLLADAIVHCDSLRTLDVYGDGTSSKSSMTFITDSLFRSLECHPGTSRLERVEFMGPILSNPAVAAQRLASFKVVCLDNLGQCTISLIKQNAVSLQELNIMNLDSDSISGVVEALRGNTTLNKLKLQYHRNLDTMAEVVRNSRSLQVLALNDSGARGTYKELIRAIKDNTSLKELTLAIRLDKDTKEEDLLADAIKGTKAPLEKVEIRGYYCRRQSISQALKILHIRRRLYAVAMAEKVPPEVPCPLRSFLLRDGDRACMRRIRGYLLKASSKP